MPKFEIHEPGSGSTVSQKFTVSGTSDAAIGSQVTCTISKGTFTKTETGVVNAIKVWSVVLGVSTPIPADTGYAIQVNDTAAGSDGVINITVEARRPA